MVKDLKEKIMNRIWMKENLGEWDGRLVRSVRWVLFELKEKA